jgi:hypothetical protein
MLDNVVPHTDLLAEFPMWVRPTTSGLGNSARRKPKLLLPRVVPVETSSIGTAGAS